MVLLLCFVALGLAGFVLSEAFTSHRSDKLARASLIMAHVTLVAAITVPIAVAATFVFPEQTAPLNLRLNHLAPHGLASVIPMTQRLIALGFASVPLGIAVWGLLSLRRLLLLYARNEVFSQPALELIGRVTLAVFWYVPASFVAEAPITAALTWGSGHASVTLSLGLDDLVPLFIAGVTAVIVRVMAEAHRIASENSSFV